MEGEILRFFLAGRFVSWGMQAVNTVFGSPCSATDNLHSAGGVGSVNAGSFFFFFFAH